MVKKAEPKEKTLKKTTPKATSKKEQAKIIWEQAKNMVKK